MAAVRRRSRVAPSRASTAVAHVPAQAQPEGWTLLGDLLVDSGRVSHPQLAEVLLQQSASGKRLGTLLVELGLVDEHTLAAALAEQFSLPVLDLRAEYPETDVADLLPESVARSLTAVPLGFDEDDVVGVAVADPQPEIQQQIRAAVGRNVTFVVAAPSDILRAINHIYRAISDIDDLVQKFEKTEGGRTSNTTAEKVGEALVDDAPVVQVVNRLITQALRDRASDLHIEPKDKRIRIRFRIDGALHDVLSLPENIGPGLVSRIKILAGMNIVERRRPQDGQIATTVDGREVDIRVSTTGTIWGEKVVLRVLDKSRPLFKLGDLGMPKDTHETFAKMVRSPFGMVI